MQKTSALLIYDIARDFPCFSEKKFFKLFFLPLRAENALAEAHLSFPGGRVAKERQKALALRRWPGWSMGLPRLS